VEPKNSAGQIFFFFGLLEFLLRERIQTQFGSQIFDPNHSSLEVMDGAITPLEEILINIQTPPLFTSRKFIWIKNLKTLEQAHSKNGEEFLKVLKNGLPKENVLILTNIKVDQRLKIINELKRLSHWEEVSPSDAWYKNQSQEILKSYQKRILPEAYDILFNLTGSDPGKFVQELGKIATYVGAQKSVIEPEDVLAIVSANQEQPFFKFVEDLLSGKTALSIRTLRQLMLQGENAIGLVTYLLNNLRLLFQAKSLIQDGYIQEMKIPSMYRKNWVDSTIQSLPEDAQNKSSKESNLLKQHPYRFYMLLKQSSNYTIRELKNLFLNACRAYWELVSSRSPDKALEKLILSTKTN